MTCNYKTRRSPRPSYYAPHFGNVVNELFNTAVGDVVKKSEKRYFTNPATNVIEYDDRYVLDIALPGFTKGDIDIEVENDILSIAAKEDVKESKANYRLREFNYSGFKKSFRLPETVNSSEIKAVFNSGVLQITLTKKDEAVPQPARKITIN